MWTLGPLRGFLGGASGKESVCQCRKHKRHGFDPWVGTIPWMSLLCRLGNLLAFCPSPGTAPPLPKVTGTDHPPFYSLTLPASALCPLPALCWVIPSPLHLQKPSTAPPLLSARSVPSCLWVPHPNVCATDSNCYFISHPMGLVTLQLGDTFLHWFTCQYKVSCLPGGISGKKAACQRKLDERDAGSIPGSGRSPGGGHGNLLQYSCL